MDRIEASTPRVTMALVVAGLWVRVGLAAGFAALAAPLLVLRDALGPGDAIVLLLLGAAVAWLAWHRARASLGDESPVAAPATSVRRGAAAA